MIILSSYYAADALNQELAQRRYAVSSHDDTVSTVWETLLEINDKGILWCVSQILRCSTIPVSRFGRISITVDGVNKLNTQNFSSIVSVFVDPDNVIHSDGRDLNMYWRFLTSLKIEHAVENADTTAYTIATYTVD